MSTQVFDSPDWFEGNQLQNQSPLVFESAVSSPPNVTYGPFNVAHWEGLNVTAESSSVLSAVVSWFADSAATQLIGTQQFQCFLNIPYIDIWPVVAPYVRVDVAYGPGPGPYTTTFKLIPILGADPWKKPLLDLSVLASQQSLGHAPGAFSILPLFATTGRAHFSVWTNAAAWSARLLPITNVLGTYGALAFLGSAAPATPSTFASVSLPAAPVSLTLTNGDAVARDFAYSLIIER